MTPNVGTVDRVVRILVGLALLGAIFFVEGPLAWLGLIGALPLLRLLPAVRGFRLRHLHAG